MAYLHGQAPFAYGTPGHGSAAPGTSATLVRATKKARSLVLCNNGSQTVYLGGAGVTTATGYPLAAGLELAIDDPVAGPIYGVVASGTGDVRYFELA